MPVVSETLQKTNTFLGDKRNPAQVQGQVASLCQDLVARIPQVLDAMIQNAALK